MRGLMQDKQLVVTDILEYAAHFHGEREVRSQSRAVFNIHIAAGKQ